MTCDTLQLLAEFAHDEMAEHIVLVLCVQTPSNTTTFPFRIACYFFPTFRYLRHRLAHRYHLSTGLLQFQDVLRNHNVMTPPPSALHHV